MVKVNWLSLIVMIFVAFLIGGYGYSFWHDNCGMDFTLSVLCNMVLGGMIGYFWPWKLTKAVENN